MLKSRHIFIQKGSLSSNDNGRKKFNSSQIRYRDEKMLEAPGKWDASFFTYTDSKTEKILRQSLCDKMDRINRVLDTIKSNEKVLIYGGGELAQFFLRHVDIRNLNIIDIVDRDKNPVFNIKVKDTTYENIAQADVIIITPHYAAKEIKDYIQSMNLHSRVICLSDVCGGLLLTGHENIWAPDLETKVDVLDYAKRKTDLYHAVEIVNAFSPYFTSVKKHMEYKIELSGIEANRDFEEKTALIIQGPVVYKQDFTYDSIQLYHENFPKMHIVLSVWDDEEVLEKYPDIECENVSIVYSKRPEVRGYQNVNLQLTTTYAGIKKAKELGCEFAFKTRTDMRFYSPYMLNLMCWYMKNFPVGDTSYQKNRLVIFPPRYDYFFFISDFFMFGHVDDMLHYWDVDSSFTNQYVGESAETMLGIRYAKYIGRLVDNDLSNLNIYQKVIFDMFAVVEDKLLDYIWYKYFYNKLWEHEYHYNVLNFSDWLAGQSVRMVHQYSENEVDAQKEKTELKLSEGTELQKVLFYVTDVRMATMYLKTIDLTKIQLRLVRGQVKIGNIFLYSNFLFINGKAYPVNIVQESDYEWADKIIFLSRDSFSVTELNEIRQRWNDKIELADNPYIDIVDIYKNKSGEIFEIWNAFSETDHSSNKMEGCDIPFIFEPRLSAINKSQKREYYTYSIGRKDLDAGVYFDESVIAKQKNYQMYNADVNIIVYGEEEKSKFNEETILFYKSIYGENSVSYVSVDRREKQTLWEIVQNICANYMRDNSKKYLIVPDDVRVISPYMIKLFESLKEKYGSERVGIVTPKRKKANNKKIILYGTKVQILDSIQNVNDDDWFLDIINNFVVLDYEMLNLIDLEKTIYSSTDKRNTICFLEWLTYQMQ